MFSFSNNLHKISLMTFTIFLTVFGMSITSASATTCTPGAGKNLSGCDFSGQRLAYASFQNSNLAGANFSNAMLNSAHFEGANLVGAYFNGASLAGTVMSNVNAESASFSQAEAFNTNFSMANLTNANFNLAFVSGAMFSGATLYHTTFASSNGQPGSLPYRWTYLSGRIFGPTADLSWANLSGLNLGNIDISQANLEGVKSKNISGSPVLPSGWVLVGGILVGPHADLRDAQLGNLDISQANLSGVYSGGISGSPTLAANWKLKGGYIVGPNAYLGDADLTGLDLSDTLLNGVTSGYIVGSPTMPQGYQLINGWIVGPQVNLNGAALFDIDLANVDLTGSNLSNAFFLRANLTQVNLTGSNLDGATFRDTLFSDVRSGNLTGLPKLPSGYGVVKGYLVGPGTNLSNSNISQGTFENISFSGVNLRGTNFSNSVFVSCNIEGVDFHESILDGVESSNLLGSPSSLPLNWKIQNGEFVAPKYFEHALNAPSIESDSGILYASRISSEFGLSVTFKWSKDGQPLINQANSQYLLKAEDLGHVFEVTVTYSKDGYVSESHQSQPFTPSQLPVKPIPVMAFPLDETGSLRIVFNGGPRGQQIEFPSLFAWTKDNGENWHVENSGEYPTFQAPNNSFVDAHTGLADSEVAIRVRGMNSGGWGPMSNAILVSTSPLLKSETFQVLGDKKIGSVLQVRFTGEKLPGVSHQFEWLKDGQTIPGSSIDRYVVLPSDAGHQISVRVIDHKYGYISSSLTSAGINITPPFDALIFSPKPTVGKFLWVRANKVSNKFSYTFTWIRDGREIETASTAKLALSAAYLNSEISVRVCANYLGAIVFCHTSLLAEPISRASVLRPTVTIKGAPKAGSMLSAAPGLWSTGGQATIQWFRDGLAIPGSDDAHYVVLPSDMGHFISYKYSWTKDGYVPVTAYSPAKKVIR